MTSPVPVSRLAGVVLCSVVGLAGLGYVLGVSQSQRSLAEPFPSHAAHLGKGIPAPSYGEIDSRVHGRNAGYVSRLSELVAPSTVPLAEDDTDPVLRKASLARRATRRAFNGAPPTIPHPTDGQTSAACLACHRDGLAIGDAVAPAIPHQPFSQCLQCHVEANQSVSAFVASGFEGLPASEGGPRATPGAPPQIPHSTQQRDQCLSCHGALGAAGMRTSHPERSQCRQCHAVDARVEAETRATMFRSRDFR